MSLIKQLWLIVGGLWLITLVGSLLIGVATLQASLEQSLRLGNAEAAAVLARTLSPLPDSRVQREQLLAEQFATGHYRRLELRASDGELIAQHRDAAARDLPPGWFIDLVRLDAPPGEAETRTAAQPPARLLLERHSHPAYRTLWQTSLAIGGWGLLVGVIGLMLTGWLAQGTRRALRALMAQARDIRHHRFTVATPPRIRELREIGQALNQLSRGISDMLCEEHRKLDLLRRHLQHDRLTGVMNREAFLSQCHLHLESSDFRASGTLVLVRIDQLAETSEHLGHDRTDAMVKQLAQELAQFGKVHDGGLVGRLKGSDFALLLPGAVEQDTLREALGRRLERLQQRFAPAVKLPAAMIAYHQGDTPGGLLASLDGALARAAEDNSPAPVILVEGVHREPLFADHAAWRAALEAAIAEGVYLAHYPVLDTRGKLLHFESPARLRLRDAWQPAGCFMPWISLLNMAPALDLAVTVTALRDISQRHQPIAINLSIASIRDARFVLELRRHLATHPEAARQLWIELPEALALQDLSALRSLCRELRPLGCRLGLEHVGTRFTQITELQDLGLTYLKIDTRLVRGVETSAEHQALLRGMATLGHSLGLLAIGEGVETPEEARALFALGFDAATGPGIRRDDWPEA